MPNALGLNDMAGNVWEWCWDWYHGNADGTGAVPGTSRVIRGGGWNSDASECAVSRRNINFPDYGYGFLGFRVACP
jgi:formylglycine-generating enzyme required for sulfatase activity